MSGLKRTINQVEKKWFDLKSLAKKKISSWKREAYKTGGGVNKSIVPTDSDYRIISIIGQESVEGIGGLGELDTSINQPRDTQILENSVVGTDILDLTESATSNYLLDLSNIVTESATALSLSPPLFTSQPFTVYSQPQPEEPAPLIEIVDVPSPTATEYSLASEWSNPSKKRRRSSKYASAGDSASLEIVDIQSKILQCLQDILQTQKERRDIEQMQLDLQMKKNGGV